MNLISVVSLVLLVFSSRSYCFAMSSSAVLPLPYITCSSSVPAVITDFLHGVNTSLPSSIASLTQFGSISPVLPPLDFWLSSTKFDPIAKETAIHSEGKVSITHPASSSSPSSSSVLPFSFSCSPSDFSVVPLSRSLFSARCSSTGASSLIHSATRSLSDLHSGHSVTAVSLSPALDYLASGSTNGQLKCWKLSSASSSPSFSASEPRQLIGHVGDIDRILFFPSNVLLLSVGSDYHLKIWSAESGQCVRTLAGHSRPITAVQLIERGRLFVSASKDGSAKVFDCSVGKAIQSIDAKQGEILDCCIGEEQTQNNSEPANSANSELSRSLFMCSSVGSLFGSDLRTGQFFLRSSVSNSPLTALCLLTDHSNSLICGNEQGVLTEFDLRQQRVVQQFQRDDADIRRLQPWQNRQFITSNAVGATSIVQCSTEASIVAEFVGIDGEPVRDLWTSRERGLIATANAEQVRIFETATESQVQTDTQS